MTRSACLIFDPVAGQTDPEEDLNKIVNIWRNSNSSGLYSWRLKHLNADVARLKNKK